MCGCPGRWSSRTGPWGWSSSPTAAAAAGAVPAIDFVAAALNRVGLGTLLVDLLTADEELSRAYVFNIAMLAGWRELPAGWTGLPAAATLPFGYFGASTGAAAALGRRPPVPGLRSRPSCPAVEARTWCGRRDALVQVPTLLIVGGADEVVLGLNRQAQEKLRCENHLAVIPAATHLFEEPAALEQVADLAGDWFTRHFIPASPQ